MTAMPELRLEVEADTAGLLNLVPNPNGELGGWGWLTPVAGGVMAGGAGLHALHGLSRSELVYTQNAGGATWFSTEPIPVIPGRYVQAYWYNSATVTWWHRAVLEFLRADGTLLSTVGQTGYFGTGTHRLTVPVQVPATAAYVRLRFDVYKTNTGTPPDSSVDFHLTDVTLAQGFSAVDVQNVSYLANVQYQDILGPTLSLQVERRSLDAGTLTGTVRDAMLNPAVSDDVRPGRRCRIMVNNGTEWRPIVTTKLVRAEAKYDKRKTDDAGNMRTLVTLAGADNAQALANTPEQRGVATLAELPFLLEGAGVPWSVNGSGKQVTAGTVVSTNENASLLDQVAVTRDTARGHAAVNAAGVLVVNTAAASSGVTFSDEAGAAVPYTGADVGFATDECINSVKIVWLRYDPATGKTETVQYGPYEDATSIGTWGPHSRTFTIHGANESAAAIQTYANAVLAANKTPRAKVRSLTVNVNTPELVNAVLAAELATTATVRHAGVNYVQRIAGVTHAITAKRWTATFTFDDSATVAQPTVIPRPQDDPAASTLPLISQEFTANSGILAPGAESGNINVAHPLGVMPSVVVGHLEDGAWSDHVGWRVTSRQSTQVVFTFRNNGPSQAQAILRYRLIYTRAGGA